MRRIFLLFAVGALVTALAATTAFAQDFEGEEVTVTGVVEKVDPPELPGGIVAVAAEYFIDDEETSRRALLWECPPSNKHNLGDFVGQRVTVSGTRRIRSDAPPSVLNEGPLVVCVGSIEPVGNSMQGETIYGTEGSDNLADTQGNDTVYALGSGDTISAGNGSDTLYSGPGWDYVVGGYGADILYGWTGSDWLDGGAGDDDVYGWKGDDLVDGGTGNDNVYGGVGNDAIYGYSGADTLYGGNGSDFLYSAGDESPDGVFGGPGYDVCVIGFLDSAVGCEELYRQ